MEIKKPAIAGTLESSDAMVTVMPASQGEGIEFELDSVVIHQFGRLDRLDVKDIKIKVVDKGALDCTLKARVECAVYRSCGQTDHLPWGGAIK